MNDQTNDPTKAAFDLVAITVQVLTVHEVTLKDLIQASENFDSTGFITDPTLCRKILNSNHYFSNIVMAKAALTFLEAGKKWFEAQNVPWPGETK